MDSDKPLEQLERPPAADHLAAVEPEERRGQDTSRETTSAGDPGEIDGPIPPAATAPTAVAGLENLEAGTVIGPRECRVRLLHDLCGDRRVWMVLAVTPESERSRGAAEEFRAIKLFPSPSHAQGPRDLGRDERSQRADLIGSRAYLAKAKARVEQVAKIDHPHIARIYGWRQGIDGLAFAEMEYIDHQRGHSLAQVLRERGQNGLSWEEILRWTRPVAAALDHARLEHRLSHQHLEADAVFLAGQGVVKLVGFGVASEIREPRSVLFGGGDSAQDAADGPADSAPAETAFRRDVFALALLVYRMLMGQSAYEAKSQVANMMPRPPGLTDEAWRILRRGLAYPSELCPTDAGSFIGGLEEAQRPAHKTAHGRESVGRNWLMAAGLIALVVAGVYLWAGRVGEQAETGQPAPTVVRAGSGAGPVPGAELRPEEGMKVLLQEAEREADTRAFESAKRVDTQVAYQLYLQRCPRCGFGQEARSAIQNLRTEEQIGKLKVDFEASARALEREGREERGDDALDRLKALAALVPGDPLVAAGRRRIALVWVGRAQSSVNKGDLTGARQALGKARSIQPELPELASLAATLKQAETAEQARQGDAEAFAAARRSNTRKAYWAYLENCAATCNFRPEAEAALARLGPANPVMRDRLGDGSQGPELVVIPAGGFMMGSPASEKGRYDDERQHPARVARAFAIGKSEVMFFEYDRFATATGRPLPADQGWGRGRRPVINVSWREAKDYVDWLSQQTGYRYRLPTETEWEYAARGGTTTSRYWGDDPDQGCAYANAADLDGKKVFVGWTAMRCQDGHVYTAPAGSYRDNDYGLHDMLGNVLEWTCTLYAQDEQATGQGCDEPEGERPFVVRGGSWNDEPRNVRSGDRHRNRSDFRDYYLGLRVVRELP